MLAVRTQSGQRIRIRQRNLGETVVIEFLAERNPDAKYFQENKVLKKFTMTPEEFGQIIAEKLEEK